MATSLNNFMSMLTNNTKENELGSGNYIEVYMKSSDPDENPEPIYAGTIAAFTKHKDFNALKSRVVNSFRYTVKDISFEGGVKNNRRAKIYDPRFGHIYGLDKLPRKFTPFPEDKGKMTNVRVVTADIYEDFETRQLPMLIIELG